MIGSENWPIHRFRFIGLKNRSIFRSDKKSAIKSLTKADPIRSSDGIGKIGADANPNVGGLIQSFLGHLASNLTTACMVIEQYP